MVAQVWPLRWFVVVLVVVQLVVADVGRAVLTVGSLVVAVALAGLVTVTTRVSDLLDAVVRWLRPARSLGVRPERVGLLLALGIRTVPVVGRLAGEVRDAQLARGLRPGPVRSAVPLTVRTVRHADALGEALAARGLDD
jgi:biotin transport system permease protein